MSNWNQRVAIDIDVMTSRKVQQNHFKLRRNEPEFKQQHSPTSQTSKQPQQRWVVVTFSSVKSKSNISNWQLTNAKNNQINLNLVNVLKSKQT